VTSQQLARVIDHTNLRAHATQTDIAALCDEAMEYGFHSVSINSAWTSYCARRLEGSKVVVNPTIAFPLGASTANMKVRETREAIENGAGEIDMVINVGALKSGLPEFVAKEISAVVQAAKEAPVKVILECAYLSDKEKVTVCKLSAESGAAFVKTSTGFADSGATVQDVKLMRRAVGRGLGVKAAGGIRSFLDTPAMLRAGANRIGTSAGLAIIRQIPEDFEEIAS